MSLYRDLERIKESATNILTAVEKICNADKLGKSINELGLSPRASKCLGQRNIKYLDELLELSKIEILETRNMGQHTFKEINEKVKSLELRGWE